MSALAAHLSIGRSHLSGRASADGVPLARITDEWLTVRALVLHHLGGFPWEVVATEVGYRSPSGLTALFRRTLGTPPGKVELGPLEAVARFEEKLKGWLEPDAVG